MVAVDLAGERTVTVGVVLAANAADTRSSEAVFDPPIYITRGSVGIMGLFDTVRSVLGGGGSDERAGGRAEAPDDLFGPVASVYVETGEGPDEEWTAAEHEGMVEVLVKVAGEPGPEDPVDTEAVEAHVETLGGGVEHAHGGGTVSGMVHKSKLRELGAHEEVVRVEVTRTGGDVREDPDYPGDTQ